MAAEEKLKKISEHVNMILQYIPYVQANFVLGLDSDAGEEPFELTKRFVDNSPATYPGYSLVSAFGEAAPLNLEYQKTNRVLPIPFPFLNTSSMNIKPKNYGWVDFYDKLIDLHSYTFSGEAIYKRFAANNDFTSKWMNLMRAISQKGKGGHGRLKFYRLVRKNLVEDRQFRNYFEGETKQLPAFFSNIIKKDLGIWCQWLPQGAMEHDANAYLHKHSAKLVTA